MNILKSVKFHFARTVNLFLAVLVTATFVPQILNIKIASADDGGYPWVGATYVDANYDWGYSTCPSNDTGCMVLYGYLNGVKMGEADPWAYYLRNCTSYVAWKINQVFGKNINGWGDAKDWNANATGAGHPYTDDSTPQVGDIAQWGSEVGGGHGHVAYVYAVNNGIASLDEYNSGLPKDGNGNLQWGLFYSGRTTASSSAGTPDHYIHIGTVSPPPPTNPLHISAIHTGGGAEAKEGSISAGWWALSSNGATQVMEDGTLNGLVYNGQLLVNQGHPTNNWIVEDASGSVVSASITDAVGTTPARIGLLRNDGTFWVRDGLNGAWVQQSGSVAAGYVSGNRVAVLLTSGQFWVKDGMYSNSWVLEQGSVSQAALSGDASNNGLIGVILTDGTYEVKQGDLGAGWVIEQGAAVKAQLSNATSQTPVRIGYIDTAGNYWVKEGISGGWVLEQGGVINAALSGNLIGVVMSDGTYEVKQGGLGAGWVTEDGLITQNALWSQY